MERDQERGGHLRLRAAAGRDADPGTEQPRVQLLRSPFRPSDAATNPCPFSVRDAISLLTAHGWNVISNGTDTCAKPGTDPDECGAGIPAGAKLSFSFIYNTGAPVSQQVQNLGSEARQAGIKLYLSASNFNFMIENYNDAVTPSNENKWAMEDFGGETDSTYATQFGFLNTGGGGQLGDYSNPRTALAAAAY